jgi:hypothetical protein
VDREYSRVGHGSSAPGLAGSHIWRESAQGSFGGAGLPLYRAPIARLDTNPTKADWELWNRDLEARLA